MQNTDPNQGIILASKSPRRRYLLEQAGLQFSVIPSSFDENSVTMTTPLSYVQKLAEGKANDVAKAYPDHWVIGADTIVLIDKDILGKPRSDDEARNMLRRLSAKTHQVLTGYCVCCKNRDRFFSATVSTDVSFKDLSGEEIEWYIQSGEPFDKAGSYAIQGLGTFLVKRINGSYTNVVGLPVCEIIDVLFNEGVLVRDIQK